MFRNNLFLTPRPTLNLDDHKVLAFRERVVATASNPMQPRNALCSDVKGPITLRAFLLRRFHFYFFCHFMPIGILLQTAMDFISGSKM
jgi:hypothetical protein